MASRWGDHFTTYKHHTNQTRHVKENGAFTSEKEDFLGKVKLRISWGAQTIPHLYLISLALTSFFILSLWLLPLSLSYLYF